jgi:hypothetical protein
MPSYLPNPRLANNPNNQKLATQVAQPVPHQQLSEPASHDVVTTSTVVPFNHRQQPYASSPLILTANPTSTKPISSHNACPHATTLRRHDLFTRIVAYANTKPIFTLNE